MIDVSKKILDALYTRLNDSSNGLNYQLSQACPLYGIDTFSIDLSPTSNTFYYGRIAPDIWESLVYPSAQVPEQSILQYALLTLDTLDDKDKGLAMNATFAGEVRFLIEVTLGLMVSDIPQNLAYWVNAVEVALLECISNPNNNSSFIQDGIAFSRYITIAKSGWIAKDTGDSLRNTLQFTGMFNLVTAG